MPNRWFQALTNGHSISLWRSTHRIQKQAKEFHIMVQQFHCYLGKSASLKEQELNGKQTGISKILLIWTKQYSNPVSTLKAQHTAPQEKKPIGDGQLGKDKPNVSELSNLIFLSMVCRAF